MKRTTRTKKHLTIADAKTSTKFPGLAKTSDKLFTKICRIVEGSKADVAITINSKLTTLNWQIGYLIRNEILRAKKPEYGEQIVATLSQLLTEQYGQGFTYTTLTTMLNFVIAFPKSEIVATLSQQLSWSHFIELIGIKDELQKEFYIEICKMERWTVRQLRERIDSMLFERTAISKKPATLIRQELKKTKRRKYPFARSCFSRSLHPQLSQP